LGGWGGLDVGKPEIYLGVCREFERESLIRVRCAQEGAKRRDEGDFVERTSPPQKRSDFQRRMNPHSKNKGGQGVTQTHRKFPY